MTLPKKEEKGHLEIVARNECLVIVARKQYAAELAALFLQYGISCERQEARAPVRTSCVFPRAWTGRRCSRFWTGTSKPRGLDPGPRTIK